MPDAPPLGKHIFVVDDTEAVLALFREIIEGMGHRMTGTTYAPDEMSEVANLAPDLVIADFLVGGEALGWQFVQQLRMSRATEHVPVVVCTAAYGAVREQEDWLTSKNVEVVHKPFTVDDLELAIRNALALPQLLPGAAA